MISFNSTEGYMLLGYMLDYNDILVDEKSLSCECESNAIHHKFCPECGCKNSPCRLMEGFAALEQGAFISTITPPLPINQGILQLYPDKVPACLTFLDEPVLITDEKRLIIPVVQKDIPDYNTWDKITLDGLPDARQSLMDNLISRGIDWNEERFGFYVVRKARPVVGGCYLNC